VLRAHDLELDPGRRSAARAGRALELTPKELAVLEALLEADGRVVSPESLVERVWNEELDPLSNTVRMTVMTLRRKLGEPPLIETVRGSGYRL
jgi:DNA-binding response OmpR family regulator